MSQDEKTLSLSNLNGLIKQNRNAEFRSIVSNANQSDLIRIGGNTLIHTAVTRKNIEILSFLFGSGFDIDTQNTLGQTPLHLAILNRNYHVTQLLLHFEPNIFIVDNEGISTLQLCFNKDNPLPEYIIVSFFERLKRTDLSPQRIADELDRAGCSILQSLATNHTEIIGLMFDKKISITTFESRILLERAISSGVPENVRVLLNHGPALNERRNIFLDKVMAHRCEPDMAYYFERIVTWDVITDEFLKKAANAFGYEKQKNFQMYLDISLDEYVREKLGAELLLELFHNSKIKDFKNIIEIIKNRNVNINGFNINGDTALHDVVRHHLWPVITYLLDNGVDPNIKNRKGETPLFGAGANNKLTQIMLDGGADIQAINYRGKTVLDKNDTFPIIANLCILEAKGLLKPQVCLSMKNWEGKYPNNDWFNMHRRDLQRMKFFTISNTLTLFSVAADTVESTARHVRSRNDVMLISHAARKKGLERSYETMIEKNAEKAFKVSELRPKAAEFFSIVMKLDQPNHLVIERIVSFLAYRDLLVFKIMEIYNDTDICLE